MNVDIESGESKGTRDKPVDLKLYPKHGGRKMELSRVLNIPADEILDFSASVNPLGPSPEISGALKEMGSLLAEYPEPGSLSFCEKVAGHLKIPSDWILATNGSSELIHLLPKLIEAGKEALILTPCFSEYERSFTLSRIHCHTLDYQADSLFRMNLEEVMEYLERHPEIKMLVLGNPNSPAGHLCNEQSLAGLNSYCQSRKILLVVDEAFIEFCGEQNSVLKWLPKNRYLIVVRSMTKFYGLAGIRLGYGVMHSHLKAQLARHQIPWSVNALASGMGVLALEDEAHSARTRKAVDEQREFLFLELNAMKALRVFPSQTNFLLFNLLSDSLEEAHQFYEALLIAGILIRNCGNFTGLGENYFRVSVRTSTENQKLVSGFKAYFQQGA